MFLCWVSNSQHFVLTGLDFSYLTDKVLFLKRIFYSSSCQDFQRAPGSLLNIESYFLMVLLFLGFWDNNRLFTPSCWTLSLPVIHSTLAKYLKPWKYTFLALQYLTGTHRESTNFKTTTETNRIVVFCLLCPEARLESSTKEGRI